MNSKTGVNECSSASALLSDVSVEEQVFFSEVGLSGDGRWVRR